MGLALLVSVAVLPAALLQTQEVLDRVQEDTAASLRAREPLGTWLSSVAGQGASVALLDVGAVAYGSGLRVIDTGGLTDARIARVLHDSHGWSRFGMRVAYRQDEALMMASGFEDYEYLCQRLARPAPPPRCRGLHALLLSALFRAGAGTFFRPFRLPWPRPPGPPPYYRSAPSCP